MSALPLNRLSAIFAALALTVTACGDTGDRGRADPPVPQLGKGPGYRLPPAGRKAIAGLSISGLRCGERGEERFGVHLEIFARRRDVVIPAGIGVAPPRKREAAYVTGGRCLYPARTFEPTGLIEVDAGRTPTLGQFFDLWGQPLSRMRLLGFRGSRGEPVAAFVNGRQARGDPRAIPLRRHDAIVLEVGGHWPPIKRYVFPSGL